jgi:hypothetical protein
MKHDALEGEEARRLVLEQEIEQLVRNVIEHLEEATEEGELRKRYSRDDVEWAVGNVLMNPPWIRKVTAESAFELEGEVVEKVCDALGKGRMRPTNASERRNKAKLDKELRPLVEKLEKELQTIQKKARR